MGWPSLNQSFLGGRATIVVLLVMTLAIIAIGPGKIHHWLFLNALPDPIDPATLVVKRNQRDIWIAPRDFGRLPPDREFPDYRIDAVRLADLLEGAGGYDHLVDHITSFEGGMIHVFRVTIDRPIRFGSRVVSTREGDLGYAEVHILDRGFERSSVAIYLFTEGEGNTELQATLFLSWLRERLAENGVPVAMVR